VWPRADQTAVRWMIADAVILKVTDGVFVLADDETTRLRSRLRDQVFLTDAFFGRGLTTVPPECLAIAQPAVHERDVGFIKRDECNHAIQ